MMILVCGMPRAGKTTYSKRFKDIPVVHADECHTFSNLLKTIKRHEDVVVDGIFHEPFNRKSLLQHRPNEYSKCIWLDTPIEVRKSRQGYSTFSPRHFKPPTFEEGWDEIIIIRGEDDVKRSYRQNKT